MTAAADVPRLEAVWRTPAGIGWFSAVNHRSIGVRYIATAFVFFLLGGIQALFMRSQLAVSGNDVLSPQTYNELFTMHGTTMMFLFAVPIVEGFGVYLIPLMIGARDMPFPRLNAFGYYCYLFGGIFIYSSFLVGAVPDAGWFAYVPLSGPEFSPGMNLDFWLLGITLVEISALSAATEIVVGSLKLRAPGMSINRMPLLVWTMLVVAFAIIFAFPALLTASVLLELDRAAGTHFFNVGAGGSVVLWQHLFWFFGHPEVYIIFLPAAGFVSMVLPPMVRRPIFGYVFLALAAVTTGFLSFGLWVHHMFTVGLPILAHMFFTASSLMIGIPQGVQIFAWIATIWGGRPQLRTPLLFILGFFVIFVIGGITGVMVAVVPFDWQVHDSFFVVAHFHYVLIGGMVFPLFAAFYYWLPKITGKMLNEKLGIANFALVFIGFNVTFFPMHLLGLWGMPRRVYTYQSGLGWDALNMVATIGAFTLAAGILLFIINWAWSLFRGEDAGDNPWDANTLEWATTSPPPPYNFRVIPHVESRDPLWDQPELFAGVAEHELRSEIVDAATGKRETLTTTALDADPDTIVDLPSPSYVPFLLAVAIAGIFVGVLVEQYVLAAVAALAALAVAGTWFWPFEHLSEREVSGLSAPRFLHPVLPEERAAGWWGLLVFILGLLSALASLVLSYLMIWSAATEWPLDGLARPGLLLPSLATVVLLASAVATYLGQRGVFYGHHAWLRAGLAASFALGLAFLALVAWDFARVDFTPRTNAYGSLYFALPGFVALNLVAAMLLNLGCQVRAWSGHFRDAPASAVKITGLYWYFVVLSWLIVFAVTYVFPYAGTDPEGVVI